MKVLLLVIVVLSQKTAAVAFLFQQQPHPALSELSKAQHHAVLDIQLNVDAKEGSHLSLQGLQVELLAQAVDKDHPLLMPGANGPRPKLSTGVMELAIQQPARFVDMTGSQNVPLQNPCWEMIWRDDAPAGTLICGFSLEKSISRNQAVLPSGRIYLSFPFWTRENLVNRQAYKRQVEEQAAEYLQERDDKIEQMHRSKNILEKALLYRSAAEAVEKWSLTNVQQTKYIPNDSDVMLLNDGLLLTRQGTLWTKNDQNFRHRQLLLGTATVSDPNKNDET